MFAGSRSWRLSAAGPRAMTFNCISYEALEEFNSGPNKIRLEFEKYMLADGEDWSKR